MQSRLLLLLLTVAAQLLLSLLLLLLIVAVIVVSFLDCTIWLGSLGKLRHTHAEYKELKLQHTSVSNSEPMKIISETSTVPEVVKAWNLHSSPYFSQLRHRILWFHRISNAFCHQLLQSHCRLRWPHHDFEINDF
eukprot:TRINITY_DN81287_c0_g1_i1.p1 TRINITY_DN81287_c0_g1~~TRINITY_DN81287_c0_g1_i1.p1  ORF type:complete len:135 (+),score=7.65 TRINITY_DN81287_c0_g1_i1:59-463(+)